MTEKTLESTSFKVAFCCFLFIAGLIPPLTDLNIAKKKMDMFKREAYEKGYGVFEPDETGEVVFKWVSPNSSPAKNSSKENIKFNIPSTNPKK